MNISQLVSTVVQKSNFQTLEDYSHFTTTFLEFIKEGLQAQIVSQNEPRYRFYQFREDGYFNVSRPVNSELAYSLDEFVPAIISLSEALNELRGIRTVDAAPANLFARTIYTIQQSIGITLDALPAGASNTARKINGDLFERLIRLMIEKMGISCTTGSHPVPVSIQGDAPFVMSFQHDLMILSKNQLKVIGSVKTSSKDRLDKIFMDKFLYSRLTETALPYIAIFLNDVQRKRIKAVNRFGINATFLPGHFKGFTLKLNSLDGVYYCDLRPNMLSDPFLQKHIHGIDRLFRTDLFTLLGN